MDFKLSIDSYINVYTETISIYPSIRESRVEHSAVISLFILLIKFPLILIKFHCGTTSVASDSVDSSQGTHIKAESEPESESESESQLKWGNGRRSCPCRCPCRRE